MQFSTDKLIQDAYASRAIVRMSLDLATIVGHLRTCIGDLWLTILGEHRQVQCFMWNYLTEVAVRRIKATRSYVGRVVIGA